MWPGAFLATAVISFHKISIVAWSSQPRGSLPSAILVKVYQWTVSQGREQLSCATVSWWAESAGRAWAWKRHCASIHFRPSTYSSLVTSPFLIAFPLIPPFYKVVQEEVNAVYLVSFHTPFRSQLWIGIRLRSVRTPCRSSVGGSQVWRIGARVRVR